MKHDPSKRRLAAPAVAFLFLFSVVLTLSPAVRERNWETDLRWDHWFGFATWLASFLFVRRAISRLLPDSDSYILSAAFLLSGWGLLTIWRLDPYFGARQTIWLAAAVLGFVLLLRFPHDLSFFKRYKYLSLTSGIALTALTLLFGSNPFGAGPRLWIAVGEVYLQPSEPLKLLLVIYLAAYLAARLPAETTGNTIRRHIGSALSIPLLIPTALMTGLSFLILIVQRDLGAASIFLLLYASILFLATDKRRVLFVTAMGLGMALLAGYYLVDIVNARLEIWLHPWNDPSGRSYQVVQSLIAIANGGTIGRGAGLGSPTLVPVAISDFIYSAIVEETGLTGAIALLSLFGILLARGLRASLVAPNRFERLLAGGITVYFGVQGLLIIGGNLRLLPLTGVTLPFVSYGGSSLLTSFLALALLLRVSSQPEEEPAPLATHRPYTLLAGIFFLGLFASALATGWWSVARGPALLSRTDNARRSIADRFVRRGSILDRGNRPIAISAAHDGEFVREYPYPDLSPVAGYTHPVFGQSGLEASLDDYLRGFQGNPASLVWWHHLLYGTPPPGLDVRLSIDLEIQRAADKLLDGRAGALVLLDAQSGEILAMASHPAYDPNRLDEIGAGLQNDPRAPLVNRAAQGSYSPAALDPLVFAKFGSSYPSSAEALRDYYERLGLFAAPEMRLPVGTPPAIGEEIEDLRVSPLQMALAFAPLSNEGIRPAPRIALAVNSPAQGWVILPPNGDPLQVMDEAQAEQAAVRLGVSSRPFWELVSMVREEGKFITWFVAGTLPNWQGAPLTLVVLLEENNAPLAAAIGEALLDEAVKP